MNIKPIRNDGNLRAAFKRLERVYQAQEGMPEADEMKILVAFIEAYEHKHFSDWRSRSGRSHQIQNGTAGAYSARP